MSLIAEKNHQKLVNYYSIIIFLSFLLIESPIQAMDEIGYLQLENNSKIKHNNVKEQKPTLTKAYEEELEPI